ncbi:hypothetical protein C457_10831 [Haloferax prahovense DSM 18310]|uniref:DUF4396 domain-containing protein n=1 Tax=Haloferax prahovense (strain DSM 18310 / JCM 13924 / TL6) TaxID=1227461 RepID=M0G9L2_HALPT|nr:DUF4396 domain-containing protein [Haloferax prahovense]ELZ68900.1 hypothetical protein C457_10831 [Haloferax prahovense DSM 18310]
MPLQPFLKQIEHTLAPVRHVMKPLLSDPVVMGVWAFLVVLSTGTLLWDIRTRNQELPSMMKGVWALVVLYSGPFGLAVYWYSGRTQISNDSLWRRGFRSTAHCYSGCGAGEVTGFALLAGILALQSTLAVTAGTFALAYTFGYALTVGPLMQEGVGFREAMLDALYSETPSITIMEVTAIGTDLLIASQAHITDLLFWGALAFSLSVGFVFAFPVNATLVYFGVKEGMKNPAEMGERQQKSRGQATD